MNRNALSQDSSPEDPSKYGIEVVPGSVIDKRIRFTMHITSSPKDREMFIPLSALTELRSIKPEKLRELTVFCKEKAESGAIGYASYDPQLDRSKYSEHYAAGGGDIIGASLFYPFRSDERIEGNTLDLFAGTGMADLIQEKIALILHKEFQGRNTFVVHPDPKPFRENQLHRLGIGKEIVYSMEEYRRRIIDSLQKQRQARR